MERMETHSVLGSIGVSPMTYKYLMVANHNEKIGYSVEQLSDTLCYENIGSVPNGLQQQLVQCLVRLVQYGYQSDILVPCIVIHSDSTQIARLRVASPTKLPSQLIVRDKCWALAWMILLVLRCFQSKSTLHEIEYSVLYKCAALLMNGKVTIGSLSLAFSKTTEIPNIDNFIEIWKHAEWHKIHTSNKIYYQKCIELVSRLKVA